MLPNTALLSGMGGLGGAVAGHGLGSLLDAPRRAATNLLISPWAHSAIESARSAPAGEGQGEGEPPAGGRADPEADAYNPLLAAMPGIVGGGAGLLAALNPITAPFAGLIGAGLGGVAQMAGEALSPHTYAAPSTSDLVKALGVDPDSAGGSSASLALGIATDPLTWAGGLGGARGGKALGEARDALVTRQAALGHAADHIEQLGQLDELTGQAMKRAQTPVPAFQQEIEANLKRGPMLNYRQDILDQLPGSLDEMAQAWGNPPKVYKQVEGGLAQDLLNSGLGSQTADGRMILSGTGRAPDFAQVRGGWLQPTAARKEMLAGAQPEGLASLPSVRGPLVPRDRGYMGALEDPVADWHGMRKSAGLDPLTPLPSKEPTLASLLSKEQVDAILGHPHSMINDFASPGIMPNDPSRMLRGNIADLPVSQARSRVEQMMADAQQHQAQLQGAKLSPLQALLAKRGIGA